jgi:hypothetical protein
MSDRTATLVVAAGLVGAVLLYSSRQREEAKSTIKPLDPIITQQQEVIDQVLGPQSYSIPSAPHCETYNSVLSGTANGGWVPSSHSQESCCVAATANPSLTRWVGSSCSVAGGSTLTQTEYQQATQVTGCGNGGQLFWDGLWGPALTGLDGRKAYCWRWINGAWVRQDNMTAAECTTHMCAFNVGGLTLYKWGVNG